MCQCKQDKGIEHLDMILTHIYFLQCKDIQEILSQLVSEYDPAYQTLCFSNASLKLFCILWHIAYWTPHAMQLHTAPSICTSTHATPTCLFVCLPLLLVHVLFVCLSVSPSRLFLLIDGQWTGAKSDYTHSIRRGLSRRLRSSLLLNSSPSTSRDHPLVA